jgi:hypothetical protein
MINPDARPDPGSWRDPFGFIYRRDGTLYRQVNRAACDEWTALEGSGLLSTLQRDGRLVAHETAPVELAADPTRAIAVLKPATIPFVSYPYEWTFGQLKAAALLTLDIQEAASSAGFELRDASAYNVQIDAGRPLFIDTLSFRRATRGTPWIAYGQFCEHFVAPLALMATRDIRLGGLRRDHVDGILLDLAASMLPARTRFSMGLGTHVHLHARSRRRNASRTDAVARASGRSMSATQQAAMLDSLRRLIGSLSWSPEGTEWADYGTASSYDDAGARAKDAAVTELLAGADHSVVWDLGANAGRYSSIAAQFAPRVVAFDIDPAASEKHWQSLSERGESRILPLLMDLANPSPAIGWDARERRSVFERAEGATLMALALIHHVAIGRNVPLPMFSATLARLGDRLLIEWVPKGDPMVDRLLSTREDVFPDYAEAGFRTAFDRDWSLTAQRPVTGTMRTLYLFSRRS